MSDQDRSGDGLDVHANQAELLRKGRTAGHLHWDDIAKLLPAELMTPEDMQIFLFTCRQMGIEVRGEPGPD
jgi:hypothetical protein